MEVDDGVDDEIDIGFVVVVFLDLYILVCILVHMNP